ncbi:MAG: ATP-dependent helicase [Candidatus Omnitrophica bacterium]|nr:ATP-dependent helicase [Candidatus Omnitrophota bacterium]
MMQKIDYQNELNEQQYQAVVSTAGPHLVIAGAGSGKTRVLVYRTACLVEQGVRPEQILLLTFTRRASREMLNRASQVLDSRCQQVSGGTFHSFANSVLRRNARHIGMSPNFTILDQSDAESAINNIRTRMGLNKADKRFPKKKMLLSIISKSINKSVDVDDIIFDEHPSYLEWVDLIRHFKQEYQEYKKRQSLMDYDDLLIYTSELLIKNKALRQQMSQHYKYIMVDEYQDTNLMQADITRQLTDTHKNIMVVGDDSQSIYSFRGAHFRNIINFPKQYPGTRVIMLEENYRSSQPILNLTNEVIQSAEEKYEKNLFTRNKGEKLPVYVDTVNENAQSKYIIQKIKELQDQGVPLNEVAVLFRSGWHSNDLEVELASHAIPFVKYGGQKFAEAAHIKDAISFMQVIFNPHHEVGWQRVLKLLEGIGSRTADQIIAELKQSSSYKVSDKYMKKGQVKSLLDLFKRIEPEKQSPGDIMEQVMEFYLPLVMRVYDDYDKRMNDLDSLAGIAARYDSLVSFLTDMAIEPPEKSLVDKKAGAGEEGHVNLSTIHSAKGLEWNTVFLIFVAEGYLPSYQSMDSREGIEEERRLFYVATTRAKENLVLLRPQIDKSARARQDNNRSGQYTRVSRFLGEGRILDGFVEVERNHWQDYTDQFTYSRNSNWPDYI